MTTTPKRTPKLPRIALSRIALSRIGIRRISLSTILRRLAIIPIAILVLTSLSLQTPSSAQQPDASLLPDSLKPDDFDAKEIATVNSVVSSLNVADWLGPLAPVALSPFFGLACLSGLSMWGPQWMTDNALLVSIGPLKNPWVFGVFSLLTLATSVPRLSKVSKPFAQAMDQLESYSVIVILVLIKVIGSFGAGADSLETGPPVAIVQMGVLSFSADALLTVAMVINLFVINSVKFFFEVLVWLTPIPAVDAMFELANKTVCAALMALYAFSPTLALVINLGLLVAALFVFRWVHRRLTFYRGIFTDLILSRIWPAYGRPKGSGLVAFAKSVREPFADKTRWHLRRSGDGQWEATRRGLWGTEQHSFQTVTAAKMRCGWVMHCLEIQVSDGPPYEFHVSRRFDGALADWLAMQGIELEGEELTGRGEADVVKAEFA